MSVPRLLPTPESDDYHRYTTQVHYSYTVSLLAPPTYRRRLPLGHVLQRLVHVSLEGGERGDARLRRRRHRRLELGHARVLRVEVGSDSGKRDVVILGLGVEEAGAQLVI